MLYEVVQHIPNMCPGNQMRDVFFQEVETEDPAAYVRSVVEGDDVRLSREERADGSVTIFAESKGFLREFNFTPLD